MSVVPLRRPPRPAGPERPNGELALQEPPVLPERQQNTSMVLMYLPMAISSAATVFIFTGGGGGTSTYLIAGVLAVSTIGSLLGQVARTSSDRRQRVNGKRRDYLRYLTQTRKRVRAVVAQQRDAELWQYPDPSTLWSLVRTGRLWERRAGDPDFGTVRLALGDQPLAIRMAPLSTKPVEDLEPLSAHALRRFIRAYALVPGMPIAVSPRDFSWISLSGDAATAQGLARSVLVQLAFFHAPDDLQIAVCAGPDRLSAWGWVRWLPHALHPTEEDAAGPLRMITDSLTRVRGMLRDDITVREPFSPDKPINRGQPYTVLVLDGVTAPHSSRLAGAGYRNLTVLDLDNRTPRPRQYSLHLLVDGQAVYTVDDERRQTRTLMGTPDQISVGQAEALARLLAPYRLTRSQETVEPTRQDTELTALLGIADLHRHDAREYWRAQPTTARLRVPIGVTEDGTPVELDLKESALEGMGPHGMLEGATGSGKSELLRTLVLALALRHSSEDLNFVLVDFKGGATFVGLDQLPHTSAMITNLENQGELVARMQDSLLGEVMRRENLLHRAGGLTSQRDYERARASDATLDPMPSLLIVVDEFSELLGAHREFMDLFIKFGRVGRSLGIHLLLASQRLDEGRIHLLVQHLSYRLTLRTFADGESRTMPGGTDARHLPRQPGNGYLRVDASTQLRFRAAYVSGPYRSTAPSTQDVSREIAASVVPYTALPAPRPEPSAHPDGGTHLATPGTADQPAGGPESLLAVAIRRLQGAGPAAHQVWLPPLTAPPTLDELLPGLRRHPDLGLTVAPEAGRGSLRVPVGVVDLPFEQRRDLLTADLSGAGGHVGVAGGPQSGKSTLLCTLITALALTHTPQEVQFYCLALGGGNLASLAGLPHVGVVTGRQDTERLLRTVTEVGTVLAHREKLFSEHGIDSMTTYRRLRASGELPAEAFGDVFLVVDGWITLRQEFPDVATALSQLGTRGLNYGVHLMVAANRWTEVSPGLRDLVLTRFELKLGDPVESLVDLRVAATVPLKPGRGITEQKRHFLTALPRIDGGGSEDLAAGVASMVEMVADEWRGLPAPPVRMLPTVLPVAALPAPSGDLRVPLGLEEREFGAFSHDFTQSPHLLIIGDARCGKSNLLRHIAASLATHQGPDRIQISLIDLRRELHSSVPEAHRGGYAATTDAIRDIVDSTARTARDRMPGSDISIDRLSRRDWWSGPDLFIVVDDYDMIGLNPMRHPFEPLLDVMAHGAEIGLHLVVARAANGAGRAMSDPLIRRMVDLNVPALLFSCPPSEGLLFGTVRPQQLTPGRALHIARRQLVQVQTALAAPPGLA